MYELAVDMTFTQMMANKVIKKHGDRSVTEMCKEYTQLENMKVMGALKPDSLKISQKKGELRAINLVKEKRSRKLKGRTCTYGQPQRYFLNKGDASLPNISLEALFTSLIINAHEGRDVAIFDVPEAYLNDDMAEDKFILLKIGG